MKGEKFCMQIIIVGIMITIEALPQNLCIAKYTRERITSREYRFNH